MVFYNRKRRENQGRKAKKVGGEAVMHHVKITMVKTRERLTGRKGRQKNWRPRKGGVCWELERFCGSFREAKKC